MSKLADKYQHLEVEKDKYEKWVKADYYKAGDKRKEPFSIVIPPPNVTGKLHLGHAWDNSLQDIIARYQRLKGKDVLYLPGMDHAGIATQARVEARLREEGISRYDLGRQAFLDKSWEWKDEYASHIREQWAKLGLSLDYSRERFTLDEGLNDAVNKVFVDLYNDGLIFQGDRIINWDVEAQTALSNIEVIHKEIQGKFYTFDYTVEKTQEKLAVSTTRPETMFADVCLVVHPDDKRYQHLIGEMAINPANGQKIPIIADDYVELDFGTGVMKCTPAHDPNDFDIAIRHDLEMPICMNPDGTMNDMAHKYKGMERFECRKALVEDLEASGKVIEIKEHVHQVGHSERTDVVVEPYLSKQWFVKMKPLAESVLEHQKENGMTFYPERFDKTFNQWLENIEDWCISRQLWWGHRIPAWFHKETDEIYVGETAPEDIENWRQDEDVLDTWFSSALWPFSTLGWPEDTDDLERYYPTDVMVTGYDIIFFWVARMAFQARYVTDSIPFKDVLLHGLIRDPQGKKMSKSLGNGVDPMDVIEEYGVDALRFFLTTNSSPGQDMRYMSDKVESSWNFINKLWNASRFVMMHIEDEDYDLNKAELGQVDRHIIHKFNQVLKEVNVNMERYEFAMVGNTLLRFTWDDFANWYLELSKTGLQSDDEKVIYASKATLQYILKNILITLHPFMPFVTEEIYTKLPNAKESIQIESWPEALSVETSDLEQVDILIEAITHIRELKVQYELKNKELLSCNILDSKGEKMVFTPVISSMLESMAYVALKDISGEKLTQPIKGASLEFLKEELIDEAALKEKLLAEKQHLTKEIKRAEGMLSNKNFVDKAPEAKVNEEKEKLAEFKRQLDLVNEQLN